MNESVLHDWVHALPFKMQAVLLCAMRGCDGMRKEDPTKEYVRELRGVVMKSAPGGMGKFMRKPTADRLDADYEEENWNLFVGDLDPYPVHYVLHLAHACEIIGYCHPDPNVNARWWHRYASIVHAMHLRMEDATELQRRLG